ncbi:MAG: hypothetical protein RJA07_377 [Bacteroidota bacterium]|jgi:hypothetical protein
MKFYCHQGHIFLTVNTSTGMYNQKVGVVQ